MGLFQGRAPKPRTEKELIYDHVLRIKSELERFLAGRTEVQRAYIYGSAAAWLTTSGGNGWERLSLTRDLDVMIYCGPVGSERDDVIDGIWSITYERAQVIVADLVATLPQIEGMPVHWAMARSLKAWYRGAVTEAINGYDGTAYLIKYWVVKGRHNTEERAALGVSSKKTILR